MAERNIDSIHILISDIIRKQRGVFVTHPQIDEWLNMGQWDKYKKDFEQYKATGVLPDSLEPFKATLTFSNITSPDGVIDKPSDYQYWLNGYNVTYDNNRSVADYNEIVPVEDVELTAALKSQLRPISIKKPKVVFKGATFQLYPKVAQAGYIIYLRTPATPQAVYIEAGRNMLYYPSYSTQLEWRDVYINTIILKALTYIGVFLNESQLVQFAEQKAKEVDG